MTRPYGSAAAADEATPESAVTATRQKLCAQLPQHLDRLERTLRLARHALTGPDPEAALGYLALLDEHLQRAISSQQ